VSLPVVAETIAFRLAAENESSPPLKTFIRKHVINKAVINYAGEGYFVMQLAKLKGLNLSRATIIVKNLNLARTFVANFWILFLVLVTVIFGNSSLLQKMIDISPALAGMVGLLSLGVCLGGLVFYKKLTRLEFGIAGKIAAIYFIRSCIAGCILIAQWSLIIFHYEKIACCRRSSFRQRCACPAWARRRFRSRRRDAANNDDIASSYLFIRVYADD